MFTICANCGTSFQLDVSYPVVTRREDGDVHVYSFCDDECRTAWAADD